MLNTFSKKEARAIFVKFLLENNCLRQYVACYNAFRKEELTPSEVIDRTIDYIQKIPFSFYEIFRYSSTSFFWYHPYVVDTMRDCFLCDDSADYWRKIRDKFEMYVRLQKYSSWIHQTQSNRV